MTLHIPPSSWGGGASGPSGSQTALSTESLSILRDHFNFTGVKVMGVKQGLNQLEGLTVLNQLDHAQSQPLLAELASLADPEADLNSVLVLIGGLDLVQAALKKLKKSAKKVDKEAISGFLKSVGLAEDDDAFFFSDSALLPGGLLVVQSGLRELESSEE